MANDKLLRGIGRWDMTAIVINTIIGAGIFGLPATVYAAIGSYSLFAFIACAVVVAFVVVCHAEVASRFSATGGAYLYAREAFGPMFASEVGWLFWIVRMATFAANCNLFVTYLGFFWEPATSRGPRVVLIIAVVAFLTAVNIAGIRQSAVITNILTVGKLVPLLIFAVVGAFFIEPGNFNFETVPTASSFSIAVLSLIYAFVGFEVALIPAGEMKEPQKNIPFALFVALSVVVVLYIMVQTVAIGTLPGLASSERPLADAARNFIGTAGAAFIVMGGLISILGNLNVGVVGSSRILYAMADHNEIPKVLATTHHKLKTPYVSILLNAAIILVLTIQSSFLSALAIATITRLIIYATTCLSLVIFRTRPDAPRARFIAPFGVAAAIISIGLILWLLANVDFTKEGLPIVVIGIVGLIVLGAYRLFRTRSG
jgi:amino acid transporter